MSSENSTDFVAQKSNLDFSDNLLQSLDHITATNIYSFLKRTDQYQNGKQHLADYLSGLYQRNANEKFHDSLSWFEKIGFLTATKQQKHMNRVKLKTKFVDAGVPIAIDLTLIAVQALVQHVEKKKLFESFVSMLAFVNQKDGTLLQARAACLARRIGWNFKFDEYRSIFEEYAGGQVGQIPLRGQLADEPGKFATIVLSSCDQDDDMVRQRAGELCIFLGFSENDADEIMGDLRTNTELFSDVVGFTGFSAVEIFGDLFANLPRASEAGSFSLEHDPYQKIRQRRKNLIVKTVTTGTLASLTLFTGPVGDLLIAASLPAVNSMLTNQAKIEDDVTKSFEIGGRMGELRQKYKKREAKS